MTQREYERLRLAGVEARQAGRPADANPYAGKPSLRRMADAWHTGWTEANITMRARR